MYEELFQTADRPFRATPDARYYFPFESMEQTRQTVLRAVRRAEGPAVVMGNVGLGKSLLALLLAAELQERFDVVRLHAARICTRRALLQSILFELQLPYRDLSEGELRLSLMERMEPSQRHAPEGLVIVVDEAHTLPVKLLEELRLITNFARQGQSRARLVLIGGLQLEETFSLPELNSFNQRIAARCYLQPMNRQQTAEFVAHQFQRIGVDAGQVITRDAIEHVYIASDGVPRLVNQVMDHALILAVANGQTPVSAALVQEAWSDLQQLPVSWAAPTHAGNQVEFGSIEDLDADFEQEPEEQDELETSVRGESSPATSASHAWLGTNTPVAQPSPVAPSWPTPGDLEDFGPDPGCDLDLLIIEEDVASEPVQPVRNLFSGWGSPDGNMIEIEIDRARLPEATNAALDGLPLSMHAAHAPGTAHQPTPAPVPVAGNPFGEDFDEEFSIEAADVKRWQDNLKLQRLRAAQSAANSPAPASGHGYATPALPTQGTASAPVASAPVASAPVASASVASASVASASVASASVASASVASVSVASAAGPRPRQCETSSTASACHTTSEYCSPGYVDPARETLSNVVAYAQPVSAGEVPASVQVSTASGTPDAVQNEIEDLISQLNFSAFSVEPESVEWISPDFNRQAPQSQAAAEEAAREAGYRVYPLHSADEIEEINISLLDDDRDMLVIEEEVPASMRLSGQTQPAGPESGRGVPATKPVGYPELFQQLRS
jgi:type II secretory pathway predicted ATPase ExeA